MKKSLLTLCFCALLGQATPSFAFEMPSWNTVLHKVTFGYFGTEEEKRKEEPNQDNDNQGENDDEENIVLGSDGDEDPETAEPVAFDFDALSEIDPAIKLLDADHAFLQMPDSDLLSNMESLFSANTQAGINFFISLHRSDASKAADLFISKKFSDAFRLALLIDTPSVYTAVLLHDLRHNLKGQEVYHHGDFVFKHSEYGSIKADYALISGDLVPAQYLPFILISGLRKEDPEVEYKHYQRIARLESILASMEREQLLALFVFQPNEAVIKIGKKNRNYCLGNIKQKNLCEVPMEGGVDEQFLVAVFNVIARNNIDVVAEIIEHEYTNFPERGKFIINNTEASILQEALSHIKDVPTRNAISRMRPDVLQASILDILAGAPSGNPLGSGKANGRKKDKAVYITEYSSIENDLEQDDNFDVDEDFDIDNNNDII